ncbi:cache domain-containing protein [Marinobacterium jannaschii]|uniref:cache domain-containing protein n=1 Tax=Marinobacterium jannaschii TaxID=64970 RepID=UPI000489F57B|nr:cache domain-containing protein [Marinobacterium jannaschii]
MTLKSKILLLSILPLILASVAITWITQMQAHQLSEQEIATFEHNLMASKRQQLQHYVSLAMTSIAPIVADMDNGLESRFAEEEIKRILNALTYGDDGYFFVYDQSGRNLVHPTEPDLVGNDLIELRDSDGKYVIQELLMLARQGGGFSRYKWNKPSEEGPEDKLSYVVQIPKLNWMMGTGIYVDDIAAEVASTRQDVDRNIRQTFYVVLIIISVTVLLIILVAVAINVHATQLADKRLQELAHRSVQYQVVQRRHFARELHDGVNQLMVSARLRLNLSIKKWGQEVAREHLEKAGEMMNLAMQEVRRVSHDLRPILLDDLGLEAALKNMLDDMAERSDLEVFSDLQLPVSRLPDVIEITLYRIVQEALTNVEKHAGARHLNVRIRSREDAVIVEVEDDGKGFRSDTVSEGIGLINMRERTELLGGRFDLHSHPKQGTLIRAVFSLRLEGEKS